MKKKKFLLLFLTLFLSGLGLIACSKQGEQTSKSRKLKVVATTTIVGDVVNQVSGDLVDLDILLPVGADPHSFDPTPKDVAKIADADVVFANGAGLEAFLENLIESADASNKLVYVSDGVDFKMLEGEDHTHEGDGLGYSVGIDPHTWTDPNNVIVWVENIARVLVEQDTENKAFYEANADKYKTELRSLDTWIRDRVAQIPKQDRKLVTDHTLFSYFAEEYGFEQVGALIPGFSTLSEPTAQELAAMEDSIRALRVKAVFVGTSINPSLAERVASDTGVKLITVYTGSLSEVDGEAATYLAYMRYNTNAFVDALK